MLDEAQRIKNWESKTSREVKKLQSRYAIVLTGTPLENKLEELYSIVQFVDERRFGPAFQFLHDHRVLDEKGNLKGYRNLDKIREKLAPIFLRRTRGEVLTQLPARTDNTVFVELADEQRGPYEEQRVALARLLQKNYLTDLDRKRDPRVDRQHADGLRQHVPVRQADARLAEARRVRRAGRRT